MTENMKLAEIIGYYSNSNSAGRNGCVAEVVVRKVITKHVDKVRAQDKADVSAKCGALEIKTGCGWLVNPSFDTKEEAWNYFNSKPFPIKHARYVCYTPTFYGTEKTFRVFPQRKFLQMLKDLNLLVCKASAPCNGHKYGIAIQSFKNSKKKEGLFYDRLEEGWTIEEFVMNHKI